MQKLTLTINHKPVSHEVRDDQLLVTFLRETLQMTGTHIGCDTSQCGACVVLLDGVAIKSCTILACQTDGSHITTIEGLEKAEGLHPMQQAFRECHGLQCGYCTPGMILSSIDYVASGGALDEASIRAGLEGNICRCTGYHNIIRAVQHGAALMAEKQDKGAQDKGAQDD